MRVINIGSMNLDYVYQVPAIVAPGQTLSASARSVFCGGKGANQSVALARAGANVVHVGCIGRDGRPLRTQLAEEGVDVSCVQTVDEPTGHAVIQVDPQAENAIVILAGANARVSPAQVDQALDQARPGHWLLLQNEVPRGDAWIAAASERGLRIAFNPAPFEPAITHWPLHLVDLLVVNQSEAAGLAQADALADPLAAPQADTPEATLAQILENRLGQGRAPDRPPPLIALTLGSRGSLLCQSGRTILTPPTPTTVCDTTAAGDTWIGYFLASLIEGCTPSDAAQRAADAASWCVSRPGAIPSIPRRSDLLGDQPD